VLEAVAVEPSGITAPVIVAEPVTDAVFELIEPEVGEAMPAESAAEEPVRPAPSVVDEFEAAARLFSFTGETPIQQAPVEEAEPVAESHKAHHGKAHHGKAHKAPRTSKAPRAARRRKSAKRITAASFSLAAIGAVGLLTVGMTVPAEAVAAAQGADAASSVQLAGDVSGGGDSAIQAYVAPSSTDDSATALDRTSGFTTGTLVQMAGTVGITNVSTKWFTNDPNCSIQWPFAVGVPITYGFGWRPGEFHEGVDFTPGAGAHIQAIADGTVRVAQNNYQGFGTAIVIDHIVDGQLVSSLYGHMQYDSFQVHVGDKVQVGEYIGRTGDTGRSFGAHTHLQIMINGVTPIDPLPWLRAHATC